MEANELRQVVYIYNCQNSAICDQLFCSEKLLKLEKKRSQIYRTRRDRESEVVKEKKKRELEKRGR